MNHKQFHVSSKYCQPTNPQSEDPLVIIGSLVNDVDDTEDNSQPKLSITYIYFRSEIRNCLFLFGTPMALAKYATDSVQVQMQNLAVSRFCFVG